MHGETIKCVSLLEFPKVTPKLLIIHVISVSILKFAQSSPTIWLP